eukprot:TRINITY_DN66_c0_g1_i1.p1 TRINITY_DN66_c0_g1~~TRINITY_DN66_c0_g1_i1.p1  ORF type:complete len:466 (-),score=39.91 TRINITY_DN66_c0_g1_i1:716-2113(-)
MGKVVLLGRFLLSVVLLQSSILCRATSDSDTTLEGDTPRLLATRTKMSPLLESGKYVVNCCEMSPLWGAAKGEIRQISLPVGTNGTTVVYNVKALSTKPNRSGEKRFSIWISKTYTWKNHAESFPHVQIKCWPKQGNTQGGACGSHCLYNIAFTDAQKSAIDSAYRALPTRTGGGTRRLSQSCSAEACGIVLGVGGVACITSCILSGPFYFVCASACLAFVSPGLTCCIDAIAASGCFPASSMVQVSGVGPKRMDQLQIGDRVRTIDAAGKTAYEEVYVFGHRDSATISGYQQITVDLANHTSTLTVSHLHYIPRAVQPLAPNQSPAWGRHEFVYAQDVAVGDIVWVWDPRVSAHVSAQVKTKSVIFEEGLFNPMTLGGQIEVDGVVASCHSDWFLDGRVPQRAQRYLPALYQGVLAPVRACYALLGAERMAALDDKYKFSEAGAESTLSAYVRVLMTTAKNGFQ